MGSIKIDPSKCKREGLCVTICCENHVFSMEAADSVPVVAAENECIRCGHCISVCPGDAITHDGMDPRGFRPFDPDTYPSPEAAENFLYSMRSVRHYKDKPVPKELIERLLAVGAAAASDHNSQDRQFVVVTDKQLIRKLSAELAKHFRKILTLVNAPVRRALSIAAPAQMEYLENSFRGMKRTVVEAGQDKDPYLHEAPCLIVITGKKGNMLGKDTALTSQEAMRFLAHSMGLGTCISGYAMGAPGVVTKVLNLPRGRTVRTVFSLGWPAHKFRKTVDRARPAVVWKGE